MRRLLPLSLLLSDAAIAQDRPAISVDTLKTVTQTLSSDAYEGRAPTTPPVASPALMRDNTGRSLVAAE